MTLVCLEDGCSFLFVNETMWSFVSAHRDTEVQSGEELVVSGRAAGGRESEVGATADVLKGPVVCLAHLSHPFGAQTPLPMGSVGSCSPS